MAELGAGSSGAAPCGAGAVLTIPLTETSPGVYETWYNLPADGSLPPGIYDLIGCLTVQGVQLAVQPPAVLILLQAPAAVPPAQPGVGAAAPPAGTGAPPAAAGPPPPTIAPGGPQPPAPPSVSVEQLVPQPATTPAQPVLIPWPSIGPQPVPNIPAGELWVTPDDMIVLGVRNSLSGVALTLAVKLWGMDGSRQDGTVTVVPPSDRSINYYTMQLGYGYLVGASVVVSSGTPARGQTIAQILLARGPAASFTTYRVLTQDYLTQYQKAGWPPGVIVSGTSRPGYVTNVKTLSGGVNTIPSGARWLLQFAQNTLATSAAVKNRTAFLVYTPPQTNATDYRVLASQPIVANQTVEVDFVAGLGTGASDRNVITTPLPTNVEGMPGGNWQAGFDNLDGGDSPSFWYIFYEETLELG